MPSSSALDKKDYLILKLLTVDAMTTFKDISKQVGLSPTSVSARIKRLRKMSFFDPTIHIDYEKVGLRTYTLGLTLRTGIPADSRAKIVEKLIDETDVISIWTASGEHDLVVHVVFGSGRELMSFVDSKVRTIREIDAIDISEILEANKRDSKNLKTNEAREIPVHLSFK